MQLQVADQLPRPTKEPREGPADIGMRMCAAELFHLIHRGEQPSWAQMQQQCVMVQTSRDMHDCSSDILSPAACQILMH